MIKLVDFLIACKIQLNLDNYKIHLATGFPNPPLEAYYAGKFKEWQEYQTRRNFPCDMVVSLIELRKNEWLFAGVYKILSHEKKAERHIEYKTELLENQEKIIGRIIVHHQRQGRAAYLKGKKDGGEFYLSEILRKKLTVEEFPGFNSVAISHTKLKIIIEQNIQSWHGALSNIKGIYLITDTKTGKLYVGSAIGDSGIWQRWSSYAFNGHGGNKELHALLCQERPQYKTNFQYTILEIADAHSSDDYILQRESYWKNVLKTREFGYNSN